MNADAYMVKWKGRESGPFTMEQLREKFASREIKGIYEVFDGGEWKTVRAFFRESDKSVPVRAGEEAAPARPYAPPPPALPEQASGAGAASQSWNDEGVWESAAYGRSYDGDLGKPKEGVVLFYAGFWARALAFLFDHGLVNAIPLWILLRFAPGAGAPAGGAGDPFEAMRSMGVIGAVLVVFGSVLTWIYFAAFESSTLCATPGKWIVGLVVKSENGGRISFQRATARYFAKFLSALMIGAGFFLAAFTRKKQAFHDLLTECTVSFAVGESRLVEGEEPTDLPRHHGPA